MHPVAVDGWTAAKQYGSGDRSITVSSKLRERYVDSSTVTKDAQLPDVVQARFSTALTFLETQIAPKLDEWDTLLGDGDCGRTVAKGARVCSFRNFYCVFEMKPVRLGVYLLSKMANVCLLDINIFVTGNKKGSLTLSCRSSTLGPSNCTVHQNNGRFFRCAALHFFFSCFVCHSNVKR